MNSNDFIPAFTRIVFLEKKMRYKMRFYNFTFFYFTKSDMDNKIIMSCKVCSEVFTVCHPHV